MNVAPRPPFIADFFAGAGMLGQAAECVTGGSVVLSVERQAYPAATLVARMEDQAMGDHPIGDDVRTFDGLQWRGAVDGIVAGTPCQPHSTAGRRKGTEDARWVWLDFARCICEIQPAWVFLENVSAIRQSGLEEMLSDIAALGFDAEWADLSAVQVGASNKRTRFYLLAYTDSQYVEDWQAHREGPSPFETSPRRMVVENANRIADGGSRVSHGMARPVERATTIGNGVHTLAAAVAFRLLADRAGIFL
jgi:DNA (cytosine-5)-methyltransferase 1